MRDQKYHENPGKIYRTVNKKNKEHCSMSTYTKNWVPHLAHSTVPVSEKAMAPHSSTLAWKIPWAEEPGRLQSMGSRRVGHDWATSLSLFPFMHWRRKWQPTPVFLPGESQGPGSLVGCCWWSHRIGHTWSDLAAAAATVPVYPEVTSGWKKLEAFCAFEYPGS